MTHQLPGGALMPMLGFGTDKIRGGDFTKRILDYALSAGYRLIDTAAMYGNEDDIGEALRELLPKHKLERKDVFITTKLYPSDHGKKAYEAIRTSLRNLKCDYIDLYLIHWPGAYSVNSSNAENSKLRDLSWQMMVKAQQEGLVRHIGVSNYTVRHLEELLGNDHGVKPSVDQVEWHPYFHQPELLTFCKSHGVLVQAYMSLGGTGNTNLMKDTTVQKVAKKLNRSPAQVLLKWALQQGVAVIPKSKSRDHIYSNFDLNFVIPDDDMRALSTLKKREKFDWDPEDVK